MAEKNGFDLAAYLGSLAVVPESGTGREQIVYIDLDLIDDDKENFYETKGIEELAANISLFGLMDPLRIRPDPDNPGRYKLTSGHRRRLALKLLREEDPQKYAEVACIEDQVLQSSALQELKLIFANKDNRKYSPADLYEESQRIEKLLYQLKEEGYEFPGRMRDHVAAAVNSNKTRLSNLKVIDERLIDEWKALYKDGELKESPALALAKMPESHQRLMLRAWSGDAYGMYEWRITSAAELLRMAEGKKCPYDKSVVCSSNQERITSIAKHECTNSCCMSCYNLVSCRFSCSCAEEAKQKQKKDAQVKKAERKAAEQERIAPTIAYIRGVYQRWQQAKELAGLTTAEYLVSCGQAYLRGDDALFDRFANNPQKVKAEETKLPFSTNIWPNEAKSLCAAADVLGCSIDWLLGREGYPGPGEVPNPGSEEERPTPCAGWRTGAPEEPGRYAVLTRGYAGCGTLYADDRCYDGCAWELVNYSDGEVVYWMPMPEE